MEKTQQVLVNDGFFQDLYLCLCARNESKPGQCTGPVVRFHYMVHYTLSGKGKIYQGKSVYSLSANQGLFILPNISVSYQADEEEPWRYLTIGFSGQRAGRFLSEMKLDMLKTPFLCTQSGRLEALAQKMLTSPKGTLEQLLFRQFLLYSFFSVLVEDGELSRNTINPTEKNPYVAKALEYISVHYADPMLVGTVASRLGISRNYFFSIFKQAVGCSPLAYIIDFRLARACELLKQTEYSIDEIAASCGYPEPTVFSRAFKKKYGESPLQYRKKEIMIENTK